MQAIIGNPSPSFWLSDAIKAALKRDPIDAELLASFLTQRAQEQTGNAVAWLAVQRAAEWE
jgi:hypothetical protein